MQFPRARGDEWKKCSDNLILDDICTFSTKNSSWEKPQIDNNLVWKELRFWKKGYVLTEFDKS